MLGAFPCMNCSMADLMQLMPNTTDWKLFAHPKIYGIPNYLPDGRLVVASENNDFWKRNTSPLNQLLPMAVLLKKRTPMKPEK